MNGKILALTILCFISGLSFLGVGFYFLSQKFLDKVNECSPNKSEKQILHNRFRCKGSGYTAISIGALTIMNGILLISFPAFGVGLSLVYMILLIVAFSILTFVFK